jgi:dTDP-4-amino-4,6-dideoxygalactose transaminase
MKKTIDALAFFGGQPVFNAVKTTMNLPRPDKEGFFRGLKKSFDVHQISDNGLLVRTLEEKLAEFHKVKHCVAFCSCFIGMTIALREMALPGKVEIVIPSLTYRRMADIVLWAGYLPRFCDVDPNTLGVTPKEVEPCINENTALILAPHPIVNLCDLDGMEQLAGKYNLPLLIDAVEAFGGSHNGKPIGSFGDAESFSLHPSKILNGAEGGYITTNNKDLAESLRSHRSYGFTEDDEISGLGFNAKSNELHAAMALATFSTLDGLLAENRRHHLCYQTHLEKIDGLRVVKYPTDEKRNWKSVLVELESSWPLTRQQTLDILNDENIWARAYYSPAQHVAIRKQAGAGETSLSVTTDAVEKYMLLPFGYSVSMEDIEIVANILQFIRDNSAAIKLRYDSGAL